MTQQTTDYSIFKTIDGNRPIDWRHVERLANKIKQKNLLHLEPILVNSSLGVIDGQHRLEVAKQLIVPIFYNIDDAVTKEDIATLNSNKLNWTIMDFINFYLVEGKPGFDILTNFMIENPLIPIRMVLKLLAPTNTKNTIQLIKDGVLDVSQIEFGNRVAEGLKQYAEHIKFAYDRDFVLAVINCHRIEGYDHARMMSKVEAQPRSVVRCISAKQYSEMLAEIYNFKSKWNNITFPA